MLLARRADAKVSPLYPYNFVPLNLNETLVVSSINELDFTLKFFDIHFFYSTGGFSPILYIAFI